MGFQTIVVDRKGPVGWITFNRPDRYNAMNLAMFEELEAAWAELDLDDDVRVIVVTGTGKGFCSGADLKDLAEDPRGMTVYAERVRTNTLRFTSFHCGVWKPVICAVNGVCAGGGLHFVADSDIVMATADATFLDPHVSVGQVATFETIGLRARIPFEAVMRMALLGAQERIDAQRALALGLVSQVVPSGDLMPTAVSLAEKMCMNSLSAMMNTKRAVWESLEYGLLEGVRHSWQYMVKQWDHPDYKEGPRSFAEKRKPQWGKV